MNRIPENFLVHCVSCVTASHKAKKEGIRRMRAALPMIVLAVTDPTRMEAAVNLTMLGKTLRRKWRARQNS